MAGSVRPERFVCSPGNEERASDRLLIHVIVSSDSKDTGEP
jgi:hypothetical protein